MVNTRFLWTVEKQWLFVYGKNVSTKNNEVIFKEMDRVMVGLFAVWLPPECNILHIK